MDQSATDVPRPGLVRLLELIAALLELRDGRLELDYSALLLPV